MSALMAALTGCASTPVHTVRFHEQVPLNLPESRVKAVTLPHTDERIGVNPFPTVSEKDIHEAHLEETVGGAAVALQLDLHGTIALAEMTTRIKGQHFVVLVDGKPVAGVLVERPIKDGKFLLLGDMTDEESLALVKFLNQLAGRQRDIGDEPLTPQP